jgi:probable F420-dependent oxidoreductase
MKFGVMFANVGPMTTPEGAIGIGQICEEAGIESLWTVEHIVVPVGYESQYPYSPTGRMPGPEHSDIPDPLIWLAYVAAATKTIRLATGILILPERNPLILAKELATLDRLSGGRVELGIGVGWLEEEFHALGIPWERRGDRTDDHVEVLRKLWADGPATHDSDFSSFGELYSRPRPTQGTIPIVVGGHTKPAARRAGRLGDGFFPSIGTQVDIMPLLDLVRRSAEQAGRDPSKVELILGCPGALPKSGTDPRAAVEERIAHGAGRLALPVTAFLPDLETSLAKFGEEIIKPYANA